MPTYSKRTGFRNWMRSGQGHETFPARDFTVRIGWKIMMGSEVRPIGTAVARVSGASVSIRWNIDAGAIRSVVDSRLEQLFRRRMTRAVEAHVLDVARNRAPAFNWSEESGIETDVTEVQ